MNTINTPKHIAVIMDGNRRWAKERGLPVIEGHRRVASGVLEELIEHASTRGVQYMTFWAWSTENWKRQQEEVHGIMSIFRHVIERQWAKLHENGVRIKVIGDTRAFDEDIRKALDKVVSDTQDNTKITAIFALNYGGRDEIVRAVHRIFESGQNKDITKETFDKYLDTQGIPDPDLIIRTGGEQRLSGFLLWQAEYSELYFPSWYMPDFTPQKLDEAIEEYMQRQRRFGA